MKRTLVWHISLVFIFFTNTLSAHNVTESKNTVVISGELKVWHKVTLTFDGPETSEMDEFNPFMNYRFDVYFTHKESGKTLKVAGYYAADGNAGETSSIAGNKWRVHLAPDQTGTWEYKVCFRVGPWMAISEKKNQGQSAGFIDGAEGSFVIERSDKTGRDNRATGRLQYDGTRYLKLAGTGEIFLKAGLDAPENFLSYVDFDGTFHNDGHKDNLVKTWEPHLKDWKQGDPTWKNGKGKAIIGAVNYLASKGLNAFSFLTFNIEGDDQNVFPYVDYYTYDRFDCSKLDQWEVVFAHAQTLGMFLHFKLAEQENQGLLDNGGIGGLTRLYYREITARFGHHLRLNWNICEEGGDWAKDHKTPPMNTTSRLAAAEWFYQNDPYKHHVVIHSPPAFDDIVGPLSKYSGVSVQTGNRDFHEDHSRVLYYLKLSKESGKQWAVALDEPGDAEHALVPDALDPEKNNARINSLWGAFMAGAWGWEAYFGYANAHSDLTCQDWRSRDMFWDQCRHLLDFFNNNKIPLGETENHNELVQHGDYCLATPGKIYIVFLRNGSGTINLESYSDEFSVKWFDPRNGGMLQNGSVLKIKGGTMHRLTGAPSEPDKDWLVLIQKEK